VNNGSERVEFNKLRSVLTVLMIEYDSGREIGCDKENELMEEDQAP
jgi:hypothetical protein